MGYVASTIGGVSPNSCYLASPRKPCVGGGGGGGGGG